MPSFSFCSLGLRTWWKIFLFLNIPRGMADWIWLLGYQATLFVLIWVPKCTMPMVCVNSSADVDFCDSLLYLGHMQGCGINQNSVLILEHTVIFFLIGPAIYSYASFLSVRCALFCLVVSKRCTYDKFANNCYLIPIISIKPIQGSRRSYIFLRPIDTFERKSSQLLGTSICVFVFLIRAVIFFIHV